MRESNSEVSATPFDDGELYDMSGLKNLATASDCCVDP